MSTHWTPLAVPNSESELRSHSFSKWHDFSETDGSPVRQRDKKVYSTSSKVYLPIVPKGFQQG